MSPKRRIGIIGGMGPAATVQLMTAVIARTPVLDDQDHVPMIVDNNPRVPSRIKALIDGTGEDPGPVLQRMARGLEAAGAQALAMPCNTAHHYAARIADAVDIPLLDMVELSARQLEVKGVGRVGILGSPALRLAGVFDRAFSERGLTALYPEDDAGMLAAIRAIKVVSGQSPETQRILTAAAGKLRDRGATLLLVACTEFSLMVDAIAGHGPVLDTLDILADAVVAFASAPANESTRTMEDA